MQRYFDAYNALPKTRAKTMTPAKRARVEASKKCHHAIRWHLIGPFHHQHLGPMATTAELITRHERLHEEGVVSVRQPEAHRQVDTSNNRAMWASLHARPTERRALREGWALMGYQACDHDECPPWRCTQPEGES